MNFFIQRPIFAMSIALVMILAGVICMLVLPIAQYPPLVPPQVQVSTQYIGAGADIVANTVTSPLEEKINGAAGAIYMSSTSTNNGSGCWRRCSKGMCSTSPPLRAAWCMAPGQCGRLPRTPGRVRRAA